MEQHSRTCTIKPRTTLFIQKTQQSSPAPAEPKPVLDEQGQDQFAPRRNSRFEWTPLQRIDTCPYNVVRTTPPQIKHTFTPLPEISKDDMLQRQIFYGFNRTDNIRTSCREGTYTNAAGETHSVMWTINNEKYQHLPVPYKAISDPTNFAELAHSINMGAVCKTNPKHSFIQSELRIEVHNNDINQSQQHSHTHSQHFYQHYSTSPGTSPRSWYTPTVTTATTSGYTTTPHWTYTDTKTTQPSSPKLTTTTHSNSHEN